MQALAVSGLAWTRLAKSVYDAGWSTLVALLEEKALRCHPMVAGISGWFLASQLCSACGFNFGKKPLVSGPGPAWSVASRKNPGHSWPGGCGSETSPGLEEARSLPCCDSVQIRLSAVAHQSPFGAGGVEGGR